MPIPHASAKSASSNTMVADLPPSSRKRRFIVAAPFSMIRLPTTVEPVKEITSTFGDSVSSSPTKWSDAVTTLTTPAGISVVSAISRPIRVALNGVFGAGLRTTVLPVASAWAEFLDGHLEREVPRHDRADHTEWFAPHLASRHLTGEGDERVAEVGLPRVFVDQLDGIRQSIRQGGVQLRAVRDRPGTAHLEYQLFTQLLLLGLHRLLKLLETVLAQRAIGRPVGLVEGAPRGVDGAVHIVLRRVGDLTEHVLGGRIDVGEGAGLAVDELAVDQHP